MIGSPCTETDYGDLWEPGLTLKPRLLPNRTRVLFYARNISFHSLNIYCASCSLKLCGCVRPDNRIIAYPQRSMEVGSKIHTNTLPLQFSRLKPPVTASLSMPVLVPIEPVRALALALARANVLELKHRRARRLGLDHTIGLTLERALERTLECALEHVLALEHELARERVLDRARARALALKRVHMRAQAPLNGQNPWQGPPKFDKEIANTKDRDSLYSLVRDLWHAVTRDSPSTQSELEYSRVLHITAPITRLPPELLRYVFLIIIDEAPQMLLSVCRDWYNIVTGLWASLNLGTKTTRDSVTKKMERNPRRLDIIVNTEVDRGDLGPSMGAYESIFAAIEVASRWKSITIETFPIQADLPDDLVNRGFQGCSNAAMSRLCTFKIKHSCEMSPLLDRILRILGTTASTELTTIEINSASAISFLLAPTYSPIFHSIKILHLETPGMSEPVDLLPHLKQLETFIASQLRLSTYPLHVDLPFVSTLRHLKLKAVSIQWMDGRSFHALKSCTLIRPFHHHSILTLGTLLPECEELSFEGHPLETLQGFMVNKLRHLNLKSQGWYGGVQLACISNQFSRILTLRSLHIGIAASTHAWVKALASMPTLEELILTSLRPSSLRVRFFEVFIAKPPSTKDWDVSPAAGEWHVMLCPSLKVFGLQYGRWLRSTEEFKSVPTFMAIIWSRQWSACPLQSFFIRLMSDQHDQLLELIKEPQMSLKTFEPLASGNRIEPDQPFDVVARKEVQKILKLPACKPLAHERTRALRYDARMHNNQASTQGKYFIVPPSSLVKTLSMLPLEYGHQEESSSDFDSDYGSCLADYGSD